MSTLNLEQYLGKNITAICGNGYHNSGFNHCAHFVSHALGLDFEMTCGKLTGGKKPSANVRVQEIFPQCPKVGKWSDADTSITQLIFVTHASNVRLSDKFMENVPKKHIGIFHQGMVYHYSNSQDRVVKDTPAQFQTKFNATYGPGQGYFYGWIPGSDLMLKVSTTAADVSAERKFVLEGPADAFWYARESTESERFLVGKEISQASKGYYGILVPGAQYWGPKFVAAEYEDRLDHWAHLLEVTGQCESRNHMALVNTYDRAKFTFGFYQLAAHTPKDNLIQLFHELAKLPAFKKYFPELAIRNGSLCRVDKDGSVTDLETPMNTGPDGESNLQLFMNYLNPNRKLIDEQEVLHSARLIHWTLKDPQARLAQVRVSSQILQGKMAKRHAPALNLDGRSDVTCAILCDILHQGRAKYSELRPILQAAEPDEALLTFKHGDYATRNNTLRAAIAASRAAGKLGTRRYSLAANSFVPA